MWVPIQLLGLSRNEHSLILMSLITQSLLYSTHIKIMFSTVRERKWLKSAEASSLAVITRLVSAPLSGVQWPSSKSVQLVFGRPLVQLPAGSLWPFLISFCKATCTQCSHQLPCKVAHEQQAIFSIWHTTGDIAVTLHLVWWHLMSVMLLVNKLTQLCHDNLLWPFPDLWYHIQLLLMCSQTELKLNL